MTVHFEQELDPSVAPAQDTKAQRWVAFHHKHPEVYTAIEAETLLRARGARRLGMRHIVEDLRGSLSYLRIDNSFIPFYGDLFCEDHPEHARLFTKKRRAERRMRLVFTK